MRAFKAFCSHTFYSSFNYIRESIASGPTLDDIMLKNLKSALFYR